ncbi:regakine-1 [Scophthalmus maximus]|uniref:regakine-1 n=1 Tax=Scophthalmus maximus TaxID=52904 RepID=UPI001FA84189|nr:regakine-1 [Scophthalmus maximus]
MRFTLVLPTLLCFLTWMSSVHASQGPGSNCCLGWSTTRIPLTQIRNYTIQSEGVCPVTAVVFLTTRGKTICSDPNSKWAKRGVVKVDEEAKGLLEMEQNEQRSTSDITPTVSTTSKKAPGKKGRRERRRQRNKSQSGRKRQRDCAS